MIKRLTTVTCLDSQGHYFLDRDPKQFKFVLNFLRKGMRDPFPVNELEKHVMVEDEFDYFCIPFQKCMGVNSFEVLGFC